MHAGLSTWLPCAFVSDGAYWASLRELGLGARAVLNRVGLEDEIIDRELNQEIQEGVLKGCFRKQ